VRRAEAFSLEALSFLSRVSRGASLRYLTCSEQNVLSRRNCGGTTAFRQEILSYLRTTKAFG